MTSVAQAAVGNKKSEMNSPLNPILISLFLESVKITEQPLHYILTDGPTVGDAASVVLKVAAEGWPLPTYQWFRNDQLIEGETKPELKLTLKCSTFGQRAYRCLKCKMLSRSVPFNTYHIKCGNCGFVFVFKEVCCLFIVIASI